MHVQFSNKNIQKQQNFRTEFSGNRYPLVQVVGENIFFPFSVVQMTEIHLADRELD